MVGTYSPCTEVVGFQVQRQTGLGNKTLPQKQSLVKGWSEVSWSRNDVLRD